MLKDNTLGLEEILEIVKGLPAAGGGLPTGWATGTFNTTNTTVMGGFTIDHNLDTVPNIVIVFAETTQLIGSTARALFRVNYNEEMEEETGLYYPSISAGRFFFVGANGTTIAQTTDSGSGMDTDKTIYIPSNTSNLFLPLFTYRWIAIRLDE